MNGDSEPPPHRCWVAISHIVAAVQYAVRTNPAMKAQMTADGKIKVRLSEFEDGCGMSKMICTQLFQRGNMQLRKRLEDEGVLQFYNCNQGYEKKEIIISTGDIKSMVPYWFLALEAAGAAEGAAVEGRARAEEGRAKEEEGRVRAEEGREKAQEEADEEGLAAVLAEARARVEAESLTEELARAQAVVHRLTSELAKAEHDADAKGLAGVLAERRAQAGLNDLTDRVAALCGGADGDMYDSERDSITRVWRADILPPFLSCLQLAVRRGEARRTQQAGLRFVKQIGGKMLQVLEKICPAADILTSTEIVDKSIVDTFKAFAWKLDTMGRRTMDEQRAVNMLLSIALEGTSKTAVQQRLEIRWDKSIAKVQNAGVDATPSVKGFREQLAGPVTQTRSDKVDPHPSPPSPPPLSLPPLPPPCS
jgi:hypothetical protein